MVLALETPVCDSAFDHPAAIALDTKLRFLATAESRVQRMIGVGLARLRDGNQIISLGPAKMSDYVREHLGFSLREAQELARIERLIPQYPETDRLWRAGRLSRCHVREILRRVPCDDDFVWARLAATMTVRQLIDRLTRSYPKPLNSQAGLDDDEEPGSIFEFKASPELRLKWEFGMELASRLWGHDVGPAGFLETTVMEAMSAAPRGLFEHLDDEWEAPSHAWRKEPAEFQVEGERNLERETRNWATLDWEVDDPVVPDFTLADDADVFAIHAMLKRAQAFVQEVTGMLMRSLGNADRMGLHRILRFRSLGHYGSERLGMSVSKVNGLVRLHRALQGNGEVREAYATGVLSQCQAEQIVRVARPSTVQGWIDFARQTTVRKLKDVVGAALAMPKLQSDIWPPELQQTCACPQAQKLLDEAQGNVQDDIQVDGEQTCAPPDAVRVPDDPWLLPGTAPVTVRFRIPADMEDFIQQGMGLCRARLGPSATISKCVELLVNTFLVEYLREAETAAKEHPIPERDGWRCLVPGCTNRLRLQVHHLDFVSQGGSDDDFNRGTLCAAHHLQGIHAGRMLAKGMAPDDVVWVLGLRPDGSASQIFIGDRLVYSAN